MKFQVSSFEFQSLRVSRFQRTFASQTFAELGFKPQITDSAPHGPRLAVKLGARRFFRLRFSKIVYRFARSEFLSTGTFFRPRQSPHRTLGRWRLATVVANVLSRKHLVCRCVRSRDRVILNSR